MPIWTNSPSTCPSGRPTDQRAPQAAGCTVPNAIAITAPAGGSNQNSDATDDTANAVAWTTGIAIVDPVTGVVTVLCDPANLRTQKVSNGDCTPVAGGYRCEWTVTITNLGPDPYQGRSISPRPSA